MLVDASQTKTDQPEELVLKNQPTKEQLKRLKAARILRPLDFHFAQLLYQFHPQPLTALAGALVSFETGLGNSCLSLDRFTGRKNTLFNLPRNLHNDLLESVGLFPQHWLTALQQTPVVSNGTTCTPLVADHGRLYLHRYWVCEMSVVNWLIRQCHINTAIDKQQCENILTRLFPEAEPNEINWQKVSVALAASSAFSVISGGPGTGKTTTVTRLMALLTELSAEKGNALVIEMVAPTGKAAARLSDSVRQACEKLNCALSVKQAIPQKASTLHRLLGARLGKTTYKYNKKNPLHLDVLIVDEASMIDLSLMTSLLEALPATTKLVLLGDKDQLSPVETGNVFSDLCQFASRPYTSTKLAQLQQLTGDTSLQTLPCKTAAGDDTDKIRPENHICLLKKSYRFKADSGIARLAQIINTGDVTALNQLTQQQIFTDITLHEQDDIQQSLLSLTVTGYTPYLQAIKQQKSVAEIHQRFNEFQLLCALHNGEFGVQKINSSVFYMLVQKKLLPPTQSLWYPGRPVMITCNDYALSLYNGDIGITLYDQENKLRVAFIMPDGSISWIIPGRLPPHETVFAMTVHKSQGSEFEHTVLVLPDKYMPLLTRELLYTGITRARKKLDVFGCPDLIKRIIKNNIKRSSGIIEYLENDMQKDKVLKNTSAH